MPQDPVFPQASPAWPPVCRLLSGSLPKSRSRRCGHAAVTRSPAEQLGDCCRLSLLHSRTSCQLGTVTLARVGDFEDYKCNRRCCLIETPGERQICHQTEHLTGHAVLNSCWQWALRSLLLVHHRGFCLWSLILCTNMVMLLLCLGFVLNQSLRRHLGADVWETQWDQLLARTGRWRPSRGAAMLWVPRAVTLLSVGRISTRWAPSYAQILFLHAIFSSFLFPHWWTLTQENIK